MLDGDGNLLRLLRDIGLRQLIGHQPMGGVFLPRAPAIWGGCPGFWRAIFAHSPATVHFVAWGQ